MEKINILEQMANLSGYRIKEPLYYNQIAGTFVEQCLKANDEMQLKEYLSRSQDYLPDFNMVITT